ncbi:hypothetical protein [Sphingomonas sp. 37zxx]|uniref:hypothetical protein n=1 Tax=Sphingomonas sp. 37zxx TaxID=1550073 RepID=UPI0012E0AC1C|nr:hypothetical protein [Sphingomonas sp. 37zxx]
MRAQDGDPAMPVASAPASVQVLLKLLPADGSGPLGKVKLVPESCRACAQSDDPGYDRVNIRESIVHLHVPRLRSLELAFDVPAHRVRRVIINQQDVVTSSRDGLLIVALPPLAQDATWAAAFATDIVEPGVVLRFEHADIARRGGAYATGRFPDVERRAADVLTFAQREVIRRLALGEHVAARQSGTIMLMGFDTNFPAGHTDAPPHVHMHLRWPNNIGSQISHFYLNDQGLLTHNRVGIRGLGAPSRTFKRGQTFSTIDRFGAIVYSHTVTADGWLTITGPAPQRASCLVKPLTGASFADGATVACGDLGSANITVRDDIAEGIITVGTDGTRETFRYDRDTGELMSPTGTVPIPLSARNPE